MGWQPIETAPKDGTTILVYDPEGVEVSRYVDEWEKGSVLKILPVRWHPTPQTERAMSGFPGWYAPFFDAETSRFMDEPPDTEYWAVQVEPTHWMPLPPEPIG